MVDAVIVSTARTPIGKAFRGAFNMTHGATLGGHVVKHAVERAGIDPGEVEDVILGCATPRRRDRQQHRAPCRDPRRHAGHRVGHDGESLLLVGLADDRAGRAAHHRGRGAGRDRAAGSKSISLVQRTAERQALSPNEWLLQHKPELYMPMIETADIVAERYKVSREAQDEYALRKPAPHRRRRSRPALRRTRSCRCRPR